MDLILFFILLLQMVVGQQDLGAVPEVPAIAEGLEVVHLIIICRQALAQQTKASLEVQCLDCPLEGELAGAVQVALDLGILQIME
jgi:hypothetical protein